MGLVAIVLAMAVLWVMLGNKQDEQPTTLSAASNDEPVIYPVQSWQTALHKPTVSFDVLKSLLGETATTAEVLDFEGDFARVYRFVGRAEPPLYVIESDRFFELAWYYASAKDDKTNKQISVKYAKQAHQVATTLYGDKGSVLMTQILTGKTLDDKERQSYPKLVLAGCQDYLCQLIIKK